MRLHPPNASGIHSGSMSFSKVSNVLAESTIWIFARVPSSKKPLSTLGSGAAATARLRHHCAPRIYQENAQGWTLDEVSTTPLKCPPKKRILH